MMSLFFAIIPCVRKFSAKVMNYFGLSKRRATF
jgi:hypothetical protein